MAVPKKRKSKMSVKLHQFYSYYKCQKYYIYKNIIKQKENIKAKMIKVN